MTLTAAGVLARRGFHDQAAITTFLEPRLSHLSPPTRMKGRAEASSRIVRAIQKREPICVFGDYDADGITSAAIVSDILRALGGDVSVVLADRFSGGYGLSDEALTRVMETGASLLITCDCGSSDHERLWRATRSGLDTIVIDHHRVPDEPLPVLAFLNPHRPECEFEYKGLASCGLALSLCAAVRAELGSTLDVRQWLDLVALGTIADVAPLDGDNRPLVRVGLAELARRARPGIRALLQIVRHGRGALSAEDVAFRLAPRINAPGRLGSPTAALELLLAKSDGDAIRLAGELDAMCERRKLLDRAMLDEALSMLADPALAAMPAIVLGAQGWHQGVVGIVAGRLAARFGKPTAVIGFDGAFGRGSARGPNGFRLYDALARSREALAGFGGHQAAAGVHVEFAKFERFRELFSESCASMGAPAGGRASDLTADAQLEAEDDPVNVLADLERFEPCGQANPAPKIALLRARVLSLRNLRAGLVRFEVATGGRTIPCFGFDLNTSGVRSGSEVSILGSFRRDTYRGTNSVEMRVLEVHPSGV